MPLGLRVFVAKAGKKGKGNIYAFGKCKGKGYVASGESKCCDGGKGTSGEDALVADRHYKMGAACINLGGWRKRNR